jgi:murein DD-endopeptidase
MRWNNCMPSCRLLAMAVALTFVTSPTRAAASPLLTQSLDVRVPAGPVLVRSDGKTSLVYELHVTNFSLDELTLRRITVTNAVTGENIEVLEGQRLRDVRRSIATPAEPDDGSLRAGTRSVVYVWIEFGADQNVPGQLRHQLEYDCAGVRRITVTGPIEVSRREAVVLSPPLRGGPWAAVYDPKLDRGHRRVLYAVEGAARIPGRFAIDWFKLDAQGRSFVGESANVNNSFGYGEPVLAVADAVVASVRDGVAERDGAPRIAGRDLRDGSGNFLALDLGDGWFAFYEHLKPGSIRVKQGDRVRRGDVLAALGNTGDTSGPHLHFHVADANSSLAAEGLPFVFERFTSLGSYDSIWAAFAGKPWRPSSHPASTIERELPAANTVIQFPDTSAEP